MSASTVTLFIDTNGFIHLRDLKDLPWRDCFPKARRIDIIIASSVIAELDNLKTSSNRRKRDRARAALKLIEKASTADNFAYVLSSDPVELRVVISSNPPLDWSKTPLLDPTKPDDQLVVEAVGHGSGAAIFSHDTGPRVRARIAGVEAIEPPEKWFLPAEKSDDERKITQLEHQLERALSTFPKIVAGFESLEGATEDIDFYVPILPALDSDLAKRLAMAYLAENSKAELAVWRDPLGLAGLGWAGGYSEYDAEDYARRYESFRRRVNTFFSTLHEGIEKTARAAAIKYVVKNDSGVAAQGLRIETRLVGDATLVASEKDVEAVVSSVTPPKPPKKPKPRSSLFSPTLGHLERIPTLHSPIEPRDPTAFYWFVRPELGATYSALQCEDFRATRVWEDNIWIWIEGSLPISGEIALHVSATNLPAPVEVTAAISMKEWEADWLDDDVLALLPESSTKELLKQL